MARIIENKMSKRRNILMSVDDVISIVREYQRITKNADCYQNVRELLAVSPIFIPENLS